LKIALVHIRHAHSGGTERYLNHLSRFLADRGHEVTIVCRSHVGSDHQRIRFVRLHGIALGGAWRMWTFAREVAKHVAQSNYDLVFGLGKTWTHDVNRLGGGLHSTYLKIAHAETLSPIDRLTGKGKLKHKLALEVERRAMAPDKVGRVIANSNMVALDVMRKHSVSDKLIDVIYNGVDLERFDRTRHAEAARELRREAGFGADDVVLLFLGTGYGRKGLDLVQDAFARIAPGIPNAKLLVVGFDSARGSYESRGAGLGIADRSRYLGGRLDPEVCYAASDLYCLPTRYDPFANSTLEALSSGLPVVTSDTNGGSELIETGVQGGVVSVADGAEALAAALEPWFDSERRAAGRIAARTLAEQHDIQSKLEQTERVLLEVVRSVAVAQH
jgi:UDP-glucose:(heptosyl)LPS alpha-1,3-glucosyltransferase